MTSNPQSTGRLRLDEEVREIDEGLQRSAKREQFELRQKWAVRPRDIQLALLDISPQIVHFSGHGVGNKSGQAAEPETRHLGFKSASFSEPTGLILENDAGGLQLVGAEALADLFDLYADGIECVVMNACYSEEQAVAIAQHIPYVVGMSQAVGDKAAIAFAVGFYDALGAGRDIEFAYKNGCVAIHIAGIPEHLTPVLKRQVDVKLKIKSKNNLESPEGPVSIESRFYIVSAFENRCNEEVKRPSSLIRIKSPHKMGKSSLVVRVLNYASQQGYRTIVIDLAQTDHKFFDDQDQFMQWFCASVGKALNIRVKTADYWDDIFGANDNSTDYFENYLLDAENSPLVLALDNFDRIFHYPKIEKDFCPLLRGWHERAKDKPKWKKLRLLIAHSQEPYAKMDINQSPFNVGLPIELGEFTRSEIWDLVMLHGLSWSERDLDQFVKLIGGHPYMVRSALYYLASGDLSLVEFLNTAPTEEGIYSDLLRGYLQVLEDYPELGIAMKKVVNADSTVNLRTKEAFKLDSMGLIVRVKNDVLIRCNLYRQYFRNRLGVEG